jgi:hypothetical protein
MQQIFSYIYNNRITVVYDTDASRTVRNRQVYTRTVDIYPEVDNPIQIKFMNQDQKPEVLANVVVKFDVIDDYVGANSNVVLSKTATAVNAAAGLWSVTLTSANVAQLDRSTYNYMVKLQSNVTSANTAAYTDDNFGAYGQIRVHNNAK